MAKAAVSPWANSIILGLNVFLVFCLVFERFLELPNLVVWFGYWHPVLLHFPIVLLLLLAVMGLIGKRIPSFLLATATIAVLLTAITGFFLGTGKGPKGDTLFWHQWLGAALAFLVSLWYLFHKFQGHKFWVMKGIPPAIAVLVVFTGHYGGTLTHGTGFLAFPTESDSDELPENPLVYRHFVAKVLEQNCASCHNPNKRKGQLLMTNLEHLLKGGESGPAFVAGKPGESELIRRLRLPMDDEEHMPPEGKKPLNEVDIRILERWIALGASDTLRLDHLPADEMLTDLIQRKTENKASDPWKVLPNVADSTLQNLATDYITVQRISGNSNALSVSVFLPPEYDPQQMLRLKRITPNIVEFDLSGIPLGIPEMELVARCENLERLELDGTGITDVVFQQVSNLSNLKVLTLYATGVSDESIAVLQALDNLQRLYLWDTKISGSGVSQLRSSRPLLQVDTGLDKALEASFVQKDSI